MDTGSTMAERWLDERGWTDRTTFERGDRDLWEELDAEPDTEMGMVFYAEDDDVRAVRRFALEGVLEEETADVVLEALRLFAGSVVQDGPMWGRGCCPHCSDIPINPFAESMVAHGAVAARFPDGSRVVWVGEGWDVVGPDLRGGRGCVTVTDLRMQDEMRDAWEAATAGDVAHA